MARSNTARKTKKSPAEAVRSEFDGLTAEQHEDLMKRLAKHKDKGIGIPFDEVLAWLRSRGTDHELPRPKARRIFHVK
ncbi:MAG: hypothetical protein FJX59_00980 [Alphaproteobacteria bacterium]|nr:hypothetical protein [Alphaproteobacteria bacterium]